jgi:hypothetical protein
MIYIFLLNPIRLIEYLGNPQCSYEILSSKICRQMATIPQNEKFLQIFMLLAS